MEIFAELDSCRVLLKKVSEIEEVRNKEMFKKLDDEFLDLCWDLLQEMDTIEEEIDEIKIKLCLGKNSVIRKAKLLIRKLTNMFGNFKTLRSQIELNLDA